jgi:hypothetical protein
VTSKATISLWSFMIPVKIQCGCGQRYIFDAEPVCGRMIGSVHCPICGSDGTSVANEIIAYTLSREVSDQNGSRETVMLLAVIGGWIAGLVGIFKAFMMQKGFDVLLCLVGAIGAFGLALCVYFRKR